MTKRGRIGLMVLAGAVVVTALAYLVAVGPVEWRHLGVPRNVLMVDGQALRVPLPEGPQTRQAPAVPVTTAGEYGFMFDDAQRGLSRYDPCRPVDWTLNPARMPAGAEPLIHAAAAQVGEAAGLKFNYVGETDEVASFDRPLMQEQYGEQFAPVVVGWSTADETPELADSVTGLGGSTSVTGAFGNQRFLAAGVMILDAEDVGELLRFDHGTSLATAVMMHEFAHVIGLAHVDDDTELMNTHNDALTTWGPGDLAGLAIAGAGPCQ